MGNMAAQKEGLQIHLVENHPDTLKYLGLFVEGLGHVTHRARSMKEAVSLLQKLPCDVLISDIGLPDGDGWELLRYLRKEEGRDIYAVAMSGFGMYADQVKSRAAGYRHHLLKPFDPEKLEIILHEAGRELAGKESSQLHRP
jgi:CheY-like chemotaxis protein